MAVLLVLGWDCRRLEMFLYGLLVAFAVNLLIIVTSVQTVVRV